VIVLTKLGKVIVVAKDGRSLCIKQIEDVVGNSGLAASDKYIIIGGPAGLIKTFLIDMEEQ
jgi:hypothetical protein